MLQDEAPADQVLSLASLLPEERLTEELNELHVLLEPVISAFPDGASGSHQGDSPAPTAGCTEPSLIHEDAIVEDFLRGAMAELPKDGELAANVDPVGLSSDQSPQPSPPPSPASPASPPPFSPSEGNAAPPTSTCHAKRTLATPEESPAAKRAC